eukprot:TRINITY_DN2082_c0_g1_i1.p1 TRINITY_DN2082_c0_g1~~TRINITY_DN2082_c0_g1_i1.p1  ORF type:complete len:148 (-),score=6.04 TRINITY_DN2082_c0_g1_i1:81-524(-)
MSIRLYSVSSGSALRRTRLRLPVRWRCATALAIGTRLAGSGTCRRCGACIRGSLLSIYATPITALSTQAPLGRLFSAAPLVLSGRRNALSVKNAARAVFTHFHADLYFPDDASSGGAWSSELQAEQCEHIRQSGSSYAHSNPDDPVE